MLVPCASCDRHVCAADAVCPFCRTAMSRARVIAFTLALAAASCGPSAVYAGPPPSPPGDPNAAPTEPATPEPETPEPEAPEAPMSEPAPETATPS
jgi:hypothetical protein